jgi:4'-phosphopantetheinyl transferase EntD
VLTLGVLNPGRPKVSNAQVTEALRGLLPRQVAAASSRIGNDHALWPGETIQAVPRRQAEFAAGRAAARAALFQLGLPPVAIPMRADRAPLWPKGVVGSISHSGGLAVAAVALDREMLSLGIDIEGDASVEPALWPSLCRAEEMARLKSLPEQQALIAATALFCAKEASYKAQYPLTGMMFDFDRLSVSFHDRHFKASFIADTGIYAKGDQIAGRVARIGGYMLAAVALSVN